MMRSGWKAGVLFVTTIACGCGGGGGYGGSSTPTPTSPAPSSPAPASGSATTISIVGSAGSGAFTPNPVQVAGELVWKNNDSNTHHIVLDDGSADVGNINPGATSQSVTIPSGKSVNYHCTIHPSMVGSINGASAPADPANPYPFGAANGR
jgi:plastocyanin